MSTARTNAQPRGNSLCTPPPSPATVAPPEFSHSCWPSCCTSSPPAPPPRPRPITRTFGSPGHAPWPCSRTATGSSWAMPRSICVTAGAPPPTSRRPPSAPWRSTPTAPTRRSTSSAPARARSLSSTAATPPRTPSPSWHGWSRASNSKSPSPTPTPPAPTARPLGNSSRWGASTSCSRATATASPSRPRR